MNAYFQDDAHFKTAVACHLAIVCVAVAISPKEQNVAVRQSSDPDKLTLVFSKDEWKDFVTGVKQGEFDVV